jgi:membrane protease YdiL (CAAX protease family)
MVPSTEREQDRRSPDPGVVWVAYVVGVLLLLDVVGLVWVGVIAPVAAATLVVLQWRRPPGAVRWVERDVDRTDLVAIGVFYVLAVGLFAIAFRGFGTDREAGLFVSFAAGLLVGVIGPVVYMVWRRGRSLSDLGIGSHRLGETLALGSVLAGIQFAMTLWGYDLPDPVDWVPLLVMSLVVGAFEAVFFRGFVQGRLEAAFGTAPAVGGAVVLYSLYHVAYGMGASEMIFLFGLGIAYAVAYRLVRNVLVLWPLLTPLGALFNNLEAADIELPWASIIGFAEVAVVMGVTIAFAHRHERRRTRVHGDGPRVVARPVTGTPQRARR